MGTSVPWAVFWMRLRTQSGGTSWSHPAWRRLWLRREPLATAPGDREPRPGREQEKCLMLGHWESCPSAVCAKGLGEALASQQGGWGPQLPLARPLDPRQLPPICFGDRLVRASVSSSHSLSVKAAGSMRPSAHYPSPDLSSPVGIFFKNKFYFFKKRIFTWFQIKIF